MNDPTIVLPTPRDVKRQANKARSEYRDLAFETALAAYCIPVASGHCPPANGPRRSSLSISLAPALRRDSPTESVRRDDADFPHPAVRQPATAAARSRLIEAWTGLIDD